VCTTKALPVVNHSDVPFQNQAVAVMTQCAPSAGSAYPGWRVRRAGQGVTARTPVPTCTTPSAAPTGQRTTTSAG